MSKRNVLPFDVLHHTYDDFIFNVCDSYLRKLNSTTREKMPSKIERKKKKRNMAKTLVTLVLAGTVAASAAAINNVGKDIYEDIQYNSAVNQFERRGVSDTEIISTIHSDNFQDAAANVINFYKMCKEKGIDDSKYLTLGFNLVRNQISSNRTLAVMDELLDRVKNEAKNLEGADDLRKIVNDSCFLEFAYEELCNMGCEEVQNDKYLNLIREYQIADGKASKYKDETPWDYLSDSDRKLAENLMDLYEKYSGKALIEVNQLINSEEKTQGIATLLSSSVSRKNRG